MKAPDKIYIPLYPNYSLDGFHLADEWMYEPHKEVDNVGYVRKDALLEWLIEQRDNAASLDDQFVSNAIGEYEAYQETIDKLNEM